MRQARIGLLAAGIALATSALLAQEAGYLDLTDPAPRDRIRSPSGVTGCGYDHGKIDGLTLTLVSTDKRAYSMGEEVTFEIKMENTGGSKIEIPWTPSLADLEPSDPTLSYSYLDATVYLSLTEPDSHQSLHLLRNIYGSKDLPWTVRVLGPKQFIVIRGRVKLETDEEWLSKKLEEAQPLPLNASADFRLRTTTYSPNANGGSGSESTDCVPLVIKRANQLDLVLWPGGTK